MPCANGWDHLLAVIANLQTCSRPMHPRKRTCAGKDAPMSENGEHSAPATASLRLVNGSHEQRYAALRARDHRFDGVFFVGVRSTGIYCRPVCRAKTPAVHQCEFFDSPAAAEAATYRACFLCRPEIAPKNREHGHGLAERAVAAIDAGALDEQSLEALATSLHITSRHLRRLVQETTGLAPHALAQSKRLALAKALLHDTSLPMIEVAHAAGFQSLRRFNAAFKTRFTVPPTKLREQPSRRRSDGLRLRLGYRPPFDWQRMLRFLRARALYGVEHIEGDSYSRHVCITDKSGWITVTHDAQAHALVVDASTSLSTVCAPLLFKVRRLFDLDASPAHIHEVLDTHPHLQSSKHAGLRVPGAFNMFEVVWRAILGQQVSVKGASTLANRLIAMWGSRLDAGHDKLFALSPSAESIASQTPEVLQKIGLPLARANTLREAARVCVKHSDARDMLTALAEVKGIGPWTIGYLQMRLGVDPDAFPNGDLILRQALTPAGESTISLRQADALVETCRPWRAYAAMHLWTVMGERDAK